MSTTQKARRDRGASSYHKFQADNEYTYDAGLVVMPTCGSTPGHKVIRLHGGIGLRHVAWDAKRRGQPPVIPTMSDTYGDTFLSGSVTPSLPAPNNQTNTYNWSVTGFYTFVQNTPRVAGERGYPTGSYPFTLFSQNALASDLLGNTVNTVLSNQSPGTTDAARFDQIVEAAFNDRTTDGEGGVVWPYTFIAPQFSSTHLIGG